MMEKELRETLFVKIMVSVQFGLYTPPPPVLHTVHSKLDMSI